MEPPVKSQIPTYDEKQIKLLIQIGKESYENHFKKVNTAITISGFLITVNGIIILANMNLIQFVTSNKNLFIGHETILAFSIISILLSTSSIIESIFFIHLINPSSHNLSPYSEFLTPMSYEDLLKLEYTTIMTISQKNSAHFDSRRGKEYKWSLITLTGSIGALAGIMIIIIINLLCSNQLFYFLSIIP
jgi:hypothetical protein